VRGAQAAPCRGEHGGIELRQLLAQRALRRSSTRSGHAPAPASTRALSQSMTYTAIVGIDEQVVRVEVGVAQAARVEARQRRADGGPRRVGARRCTVRDEGFDIEQALRQQAGAVGQARPRASPPRWATGTGRRRVGHRSRAA
jgi:hypothetical protein